MSHFTVLVYWPNKFRRLYDNIPADHVVAVVDCHV